MNNQQIINLINEIETSLYDNFKKDLLEWGVTVEENNSSKTFAMVLSVLQLCLLSIFAIYIISLI